jgi:hypothetical protein
MTQAIRKREAEIAQAVSVYLYEAGGIATIAQIRRALPHYLELNDNDRCPSLTRSGEEVWEQQVRNIVCHRDSDGNPIKNGEFIYSPRRLRLADGPQGELFE